MAEVLDVAAAAVSEGMLAENAGAYVVKHQEGTASQGSGFMLRFIQVKPEDVVDVFVYVAVLNLAIEHLPAVIERELHAFVLTAVLLKLSLELVLIVKARAMTRFPRRDDRPREAHCGAAAVGDRCGSKIVVLELENLVFGDAVSLGGFVSITLLVVTLLLSRTAVRRLLSSEDDEASNASETDPTPSP